MGKKYTTPTASRIIGIYSNEYNKSVYLRELARAIKIDHKAVGLQLKKLEHANVLSSVKKGRNLEYRLNLDNIVTKYYIILSEIFAAKNLIENNFMIKKLIEAMGRDVDGSIILFGSFAKGKETKDSDIDIMILTDKIIKYEPSRYRLTHEVGSGINREINIKEITKDGLMQGLRKNDPLVHEIVNNHILLKGAEEFCNILWEYYGGR
jgi:predicted nucleotidyltransferase